jgi:hypothetical protein
MFRGIHGRGEVFTLAVHPERIGPCSDGVAAVLDEASRAAPPVWFARLDEVARWWRDRTATPVQVHEHGPGQLRLHHDGPPGTRFLVRGIGMPAGERWDDGWTIARSATIDLATDLRPLVAVDPRSAPALTAFLRQQGFIVEPATDGARHTVFLHRPRFGPADQLDLLDQLERGHGPLVRLSRWPDGAKSALCLTGDLDALTLWDYALRAFGR